MVRRPRQPLATGTNSAFSPHSGWVGRPGQLDSYLSLRGRSVPRGRRPSPVSGHDPAAQSECDLLVLQFVRPHRHARRHPPVGQRRALHAARMRFDRPVGTGPRYAGRMPAGWPFRRRMTRRVDRRGRLLAPGLRGGVLALRHRLVLASPSAAPRRPERRPALQGADRHELGGRLLASRREVGPGSPPWTSWRRECVVRHRQRVDARPRSGARSGRRVPTGPPKRHAEACPRCAPPGRPPAGRPPTSQLAPQGVPPLGAVGGEAISPTRLPRHRRSPPHRPTEWRVDSDPGRFSPAG